MDWFFIRALSSALLDPGLHAGDVVWAHGIPVRGALFAICRPAVRSMRSLLLCMTPGRVSAEDYFGVRAEDLISWMCDVHVGW